MKVLFFTNNLFGKDGWSRYSLDIINSLQKIGIGVICLVNKKNNLVNFRQYEILRQPLKYFVNPFNLISDFLKIKKIINQENPNIVHFLVEPYALFLPFIYHQKFQYFLSICGSYALLPIKSIRTRFLAKDYYKKVTRIISISSYTKNRLIEIAPKLSGKISVVNCGVDLADMELFTPHNLTKNIVFIGAVKERKGLLEALGALKTYKDKFGSNFLFNIIGDYNENSNYYKILKEFIVDNNLQNEIKFLGVIDEKEKINYLQRADLFFMLSKVCGDYFEGFGLVYLEANKYGVPVIGPNNGGPTDAIKNGFSGFLVDVNNAEEIASKINLILNENSINRKNCFEWAQKNDIIIKIEEIRKLYIDYNRD